MFYADSINDLLAPVDAIPSHNLPVLEEHKDLITKPVYSKIEEFMREIELIQAQFGLVNNPVDVSPYFSETKYAR